MTGAPGSPTTIDIERRPERRLARRDRIDCGGCAAGRRATSRWPIRRSTSRTRCSTPWSRAASRSAGCRSERRDWRNVVAPRCRGVSCVETQSPPLRDIATTMMKVSQNLYAETLLKAIGATPAAPGTAEAGRAAARAHLRRPGASRADGYVQADGSGLSRYDYVTRRHDRRDPRAHVPRSAAPRRVRGDAADCRQGRHDLDADEETRARKGMPSRRPDRSRTCARCRATSGRGTARRWCSRSSPTTSPIPAATVNWIADLAVEALANFTRRQADRADGVKRSRADNRDSVRVRHRDPRAHDFLLQLRELDQRAAGFALARRRRDRRRPPSSARESPARRAAP